MTMNAMPAVAAAKVRNTKCGMPGTKPKMVRMPAAMNKAGTFDNWLVACSVIDSDVVTRVTMMAVAKDKNKEGIWATKPSPIVNKT